MGKTLVVGAGGVSHAAVHKMAMNSDIFTEITLASRTKSKCDAIAKSVKERVGVEIATAELDAYALRDRFEARRPRVVPDGLLARARRDGLLGEFGHLTLPPLLPDRRCAHYQPVFARQHPCRLR